MMEGAEEKSVVVRWAPPLPLPAFQAPSSAAGQGTASVNVLSLGFAATAILLSLFLLMALFERFLRPTSPPPSSAAASASKLHSSPLPPSDLFVGVSVVMPGHSTPTFIANPAPLSTHPPMEAAAMRPCSGSCPIHTSFPTSSCKRSLQEQGLPISTPGLLN